LSLDNKLQNVSNSSRFNHCV